MIRTLQKKRILSMLQQADGFKLLILDKETQDIMSPLLKVSDLRESGVTCHFSIDESRAPIREVPAIYFISSYNNLCSDILRNLYNSYFINISSSFKRSELEDLAVKTAENKNAGKIQVVYDQFLDFIAIQEDLFTLNITNSFINRADPSFLRKTIIGLFSFFVTLNEVPAIISKNNEIPKMLQQKIKNTKIIKNSLKYPLLIVIDREFDIITPIKHVMGYIEILHDLFSVHLNKVIIKDGNINLDSDCDFYKKHIFKDFIDVSDTVDKELHAYKKEMALRSLSDKSNKEDIQAALDSAPHLQKKNEIVNTHLNLCLKILEEIKKRKLDDFYRMENHFEKEDLMELSESGNDTDILRFCLSMINSKYDDLIGPILQKRKIKSDIVDYYRANVLSEETITSKMKGLLFKKSLPIVKQVEEALNQVKSQNFVDNVCDVNGAGIFLSEISKVVVYINGGATYTELGALKEVEKTYKIPIILGGSEILNAEGFINQIGNIK